MSESFLESVKSIASGGAFPGINAEDIIGFCRYWYSGNSKFVCISGDDWDGNSDLEFTMYVAYSYFYSQNNQTYIYLNYWDIYGGSFILSKTSSKRVKVTSGSQKYHYMDRHSTDGSSWSTVDNESVYPYTNCTNEGVLTYSNSSNVYQIAGASQQTQHFFPCLTGVSRSDNYLCDLIIRPRRSLCKDIYIMDLLIFIFLFSTRTKKGG